MSVPDIVSVAKMCVPDIASIAKIRVFQILQALLRYECSRYCKRCQDMSVPDIGSVAKI